jgi:GNAT superfamily N-acetyltransferase
VSVTIRPVEPADIPAMAAIRAAEWETDAYWRDRIGRYLSGKQSPQQALAERAAFVAVEDGRIVGFVAGHRTRRLGCDGELQWINVESSSRGQGIAGGLMDAIGAWFVGHGVLRVCVNVEPENGAARRLYSKHGAQRLNNYWMIWEDSAAIVG